MIFDENERNLAVSAEKRRIGLYVKQDPEALKKAEEFEKWLKARGVVVVRMQSYSPETEQQAGINQYEAAPPDLFCVFVLGGDGTFLSASRWIGKHPTPIVGVKFGQIGFLAETTVEDLFAMAGRILNNHFAVEERFRLRVEVVRKNEVVAAETVLNEVVINKGALARLAQIEAYIDDHYLTTYKSDGLIVATPTGSTAYSLAAGGPVIHPEVQGIIITPICPFALTNRPMIIPNTVGITIKIGEKASDIFVTFDGQKGFEIDPDYTIVITKSPHPVYMISQPDKTYFDVLKAKFRWSGRF